MSLLFIPERYVSNERYDGGGGDDDDVGWENSLVHQSSLAILPAESSGSKCLLSALDTVPQETFNML
jgi:hypothetical protein